MLTATDCTVLRNGQTVLEHLSLRVAARSRIGIVGANGAGKTTLLRLLAGDLTPDTGKVVRDADEITVGVLPQEPDARPGETLRAYLERRTGLAAADTELEAATAALADADDAALARYSTALDHWTALGGADFDARIGGVLADVGLPESRLDVEIGALSGGQAARAALAAILLSRFDVMLLDEPTNNLDFAGLDRLERFLAGLPGAVVVVSHDRAFLDRSVDRILWLEPGVRTAAEYAGGFSDAVAAREIARGQQAAAYAGYRAKRDELTDRISTQKQWMDTGVRAKRAKARKGDSDKISRNFSGDRTEKQAAKVRISEKALDRLEADAVDKPWEPWELRLDFGTAPRGGDVTARLTDAVIRRGGFVLGPVSLEIGHGERVALSGPNGCGKSTLLGAILGTIPLESGERRLGPGVVCGTLDQDRERFAGDAAMLDTFVDASGLTTVEARTLLAKFGLGADHVIRPGGALSPGERTRTLLALLSVSGVNCLILDEPTNHLDVEAIEQLETALDAFGGTVILVSHDRAFLDRVRLDRTLNVETLAAEAP